MSISFGAFPEPTDRTVYDNQEVAVQQAQEAYARTQGVHQYVLQIEQINKANEDWIVTLGYIIRGYSDLWIEFGGPDNCTIVYKI